jgi:pimeloyl-ACP methyl ester carboxylesterase
MHRFELEINGLTLEYFTYGSGKPVFAFHGFGRSAQDFEPFTEVLDADEMLIAVNLFQHQGSKWSKTRPMTESLTREELRYTILNILEKLQKKRFSLWGYSMGGRISLSILQDMAPQIDKVMLMATDGLKVAPIYKFAAHTSLGRGVYRMLMKNPKIIIQTVAVGKKIGLFDAKFHRFINVHLETKEKAKLVYEAWLIYRYCHPNLPELARAIEDNKVSFTMIFGKYDSVIKPEFGKLLSQHLAKLNYHIIPSGHLLMTPETIQYIVENRLWERKT